MLKVNQGHTLVVEWDGSRGERFGGWQNFGGGG